MTQFTNLPLELVLEIITNFLGFYDSINLVQTCKIFYKFNESKAFWRHLAVCTQRFRPTPVPKDWRSLELEDIRELSIKSRRLSASLSQKTMQQPQRIWTLTPPESATPATVPESKHVVNEVGLPAQNNPQLWVWLLRDGKHLMSMSKKGILRVWDIQSSNIVGRIQIIGKPLCWDYTVDDEGVTIIVNVDCVGKPGDMFCVWRMPWNTGEATLLLERHLLGNIRSNYIEGTITGCISINDSNEVFIYVADWVSLEEAYITTPIVLPENLSAATSSQDLALYAEDSSRAVFYTYPLEDLSRLLATPMSRSHLRPNIWKYFEYSGKPIEGAGLWIPTCRMLWDGRIGVFSRSMTFDLDPADQYLVSLAIPDMETEGGDLNTRGFSSRWSMINRLALRVTAESGMVESPEQWDVCTMGMYGKTAVWLEYNPNSDSDAEAHERIGKVYFADFPVEKHRERISSLKGREEGGTVDEDEEDDEDGHWVTSSGEDDDGEERGATVDLHSPEMESFEETLHQEDQPESSSFLALASYENEGGTIPNSDQEHHETDDNQHQATVASQQQNHDQDQISLQIQVENQKIEQISLPTRSTSSSSLSPSSLAPAEPVSEAMLELVPEPIAAHESVATSTPGLEAETDEESADPAPEPEVESEPVTPSTPPPPRAPAEFGNFCVYDITQDWKGKGEEYNDVYSMDFDDARGRLVFATGSGKLVLYEFV